MQFPLESILENKPSTQPFILAVGTSKAAVSTYYIVFDNHIVKSPRQDILTAFDLCVKCHFVFNLKFAQPLEHFFKFVCVQCYKIPCENVTSRIRELQTKFENFDED